MLRIGNIHYKWLISKQYRPERTLLQIFPIDNPEKQLELELIGANLPIVVNDAQSWLEYALRRNWGSPEHKQMKIRVQGTVVQQLPYLYGDAQALAEKVAIFCKRKPVAAFQQQLNKQELEAAEASLNLEFPYLLKELYIINGTLGGWGPDSGFFPISPIQRFSLLGGFEKDELMPFWRTVPQLRPFLHWGTDVFSLIDCQSPLGAIYAFDCNLKNQDNNWEDCCWLGNESLYHWIEFWLRTDAYGLALWRNMYEIKGLLK